MKLLGEMTVEEVAVVLAEMTADWPRADTEDGGMVEDHLADDFSREDIAANREKIASAWENDNGNCKCTSD